MLGKTKSMMNFAEIAKGENIMMKDVTILTFDDIEKIRQDIANMQDIACDGRDLDIPPRRACEELLVRLANLEEMFM